MATVLPTLLATERETLVFAKQEDTFGAGVKPGAADQILAISEVDPAQNLAFLADQQRRNTYSEINDYPGRYEPGELTLSTYMKPSGAAGTAPEGDALYTALFGVKTVNAGVSVQYTPLPVGTAKPSLTLWVKKGHFVYMCWGTLLTRGRFPMKAGNSDDALSQCELSARFAELRWTGTDELAAAASLGATTVTVKDARKFSVASYIQFPGDDNGGAGYQVSAVNYATNVLTIPALVSAHAIDSLVSPWLPAGTESGDPVHGRLGAATHAGVSLPLLSADVTYEQPVKLLNEEKNGKDFADRFILTGKRVVTVDMELYFDANAPRFFYAAQKNVKADVVLPWGTTAGKIITLTAKNVRFNAPKVTGGEEKVQRLSGKPFASAAFNDELTLTWT